MQQRFTLSIHGIIALVLILLMIASEYIRQSNTSWNLIGIDILIYAVGVLILSLWRESYKGQKQRNYTGGSSSKRTQAEFDLFRMILGCHIAFFFLLVGIWFVFGQDNLGNLEITAIPAGLLIPFLLLQKGDSSYAEVNVHGLVSLVLIAIMFFVGFLLSWNVVWWYFIGAIAGYASIIALATYLRDTNNMRNNIQVLRLLLGFHLAFILLLVGVALQFRNADVYTIYFVASVAGGIAVPFLLLRIKA